MLVHLFLPSRSDRLMRRGATKQTETVGDEASIDASGRFSLEADRRARACIKSGRPCSYSLLPYLCADLTLKPTCSSSRSTEATAVSATPPRIVESSRPHNSSLRDATAAQQIRLQIWRTRPQSSPLPLRRFLRAKNRFPTLSQTGSAPSSPPFSHLSSSAPQLLTTNTMTIRLLWTLLVW